MPLTKGHFPQQNPLDTAYGLGGRNGAVGNIPWRSNAQFFGPAITDTTSVLVSGSTTFVMVPVEPGDIFTTVAIQIGNTAASTPTHFSIALYSGVLTTAKLLGTQSTDTTTTAIAANTLLATKLGATYQVTGASTESPYGYIYVGIGYTGTASPSALGWTVSVRDYSFVASSPWVNKGLWCGTQAVGAGGTNAATVTLASNSAQAACPAVYLY